ncbi:ubiquinone menaquinone biosynthesis methyltransferase [Stylonychia lemnae]|uniref:Ubiquinone menaquinone biosynthesis methyltransferase n=1 Tax=Stylonychia lemnae TaxID=5949 RepID=A0A077ZMZ7_STYLE|nr:ubiquinone menaquinone biosynthesis methyltransferase [Stylonychia lemnae]|eukprot:CDW71332.1 ubiquinone menaquinone biosynthesis methyltransferase [Stylonychia lemnae]
MATQPFMTLSTQTNAFKCKRILEVACGGGYQSLMLAKTMLQKGGALVIGDISSKMMELVQSKFDDKELSSGYTDVAGNKYHITTEPLLPLGDHTFDIEEEIKKHTENESDRIVFGSQANNESLPFKDESFDCYIANLSLQLVDNHLNQLKEALRVCKSGSKFGFSVWGREGHNNNYGILEGLLDKYGVGPKEKPARTNHHLGQDPAGMKKQMTELGFSNIKIWYEPMNIPYKDFEDYYQTFFEFPNSVIALSKLNEDQRCQIKQDAKELFDNLMGENVLDPVCFEIMIIIAEKK